jgi:hypothetical protein
MPNLLLDGTLSLIVCGCALLAASRSGPLGDAGAIALTTGGLAAITLTKQIVRPDISPQLVGIVAVGAALLLARCWPLLHPSQRAAIWVAAGVALGLAADGAHLRRYARDVAHGLGTLPRNARFLLADGALVENRRAAHFADERNYVQHAEAIRRLRVLAGLAPSSPPKPTRVFALGDDPVFYVALGLKPPYYITLYNASPLSAQLRVARWLAEEAPDWTVWKPSFRQFDAVPNVVRVPLIYATVVRRYDFAETAGDFDILRRRSQPGPPDLDYWTARLGSDVDLGMLPAHSRLGRAKVCAGGSRCAPVLHLRVAAPVDGRTTTVPLHVAGRKFRVLFREKRRQKDYFIPLRRLWFWRPHAAGFDQTEGASAHLEWRTAEALLY